MNEGLASFRTARNGFEAPNQLRGSSDKPDTEVQSSINRSMDLDAFKPRDQPENLNLDARPAEQSLRDTGGTIRSRLPSKKTIDSKVRAKS